MMTKNRQLTRAIVRPPGASFIAGLTTADLGPPEYAPALKQHAAYCETLESCGLTLTHLPAEEHYPDSTFVEDTAVIVRPLGVQTTAAIAVITRPGAASRLGEITSIQRILTQLFSEVSAIAAPGTLDGGDVCEAGDHYFIGISERTNEHGATQLAEFLKSFGYSCSFVDIRGMANVLHLKSAVSYLGDNRLVVADELVSRSEFRSFEIVRLNRAEEYAANCLVVNDSALIAAGFPRFEETLRLLGYKTLLLAMTEFQKLDGGLSCLSLRW
jgi:dimethylargininase